MKAALTGFYNYFFNAATILRSKRLAWIDYAKGLSIFLVVYHHSFLGLITSGLQVNTWLINTNMIVYSFRVPLFFILSGVFIQQGLKKRGLAKYIGYRSRILLYPYLLWVFMEVSAGYFVQAYANFPWSPIAYLAAFYNPKLLGPLWYLIALFNASAVYAFLYTTLHMKGASHLILGIALYLLSPALSFNSMLQEFSIYYLYLAMGTMLSSVVLNHENDRLFGSPKVFLILLPFFVISQIYFIHHEGMDPFFMEPDKSGFTWIWLLQKDWVILRYFLIVMIGSMLMVNICFFLQKADKLRILRVIGFHSLYIYLLHMVLVVALRNGFIHLFHYTNSTVILFSQIVFACAGGVMIYNVCKHRHLNFLFEYDMNDLKKLLHISPGVPQIQKA
ncbi:MAG: acyltransferase [Chitinophagaceae bacterium]|nr:MAG: acyltransferase [Chitinophagaceae bacterium]